jgi:hypothetical protein
VRGKGADLGSAQTDLLGDLSVLCG